MKNVINYPFDADYRAIASAIVSYGQEKITSDLIKNGFSDTVAKIIVKKALSKGWGS